MANIPRVLPTRAGFWRRKAAAGTSGFRSCPDHLDRRYALYIGRDHRGAMPGSVGIWARCWRQFGVPALEDIASERDLPFSVSLDGRPGIGRGGLAAHGMRHGI